MSPVLEDLFMSDALRLLRSIASDVRALREHLIPDSPDTEGPDTP